MLFQFGTSALCSPWIVDDKKNPGAFVALSAHTLHVILRLFCQVRVYLLVRPKAVMLRDI
jgi:hypothetical protein